MELNSNRGVSLYHKIREPHANHGGCHLALSHYFWRGARAEQPAKLKIKMWPYLKLPPITWVNWSVGTHLFSQDLWFTNQYIHWHKWASESVSDNGACYWVSHHASFWNSPTHSVNWSIKKMHCGNVVNMPHSQLHWVKDNIFWSKSTLWECWLYAL